jgi:hypothetical protein
MRVDYLMMIISDCWLGFRGDDPGWPRFDHSQRIWFGWLARSLALIMLIKNLGHHTRRGQEVGGTTRRRGRRRPWAVVVEHLYVYQTSFGLSSGQILRRSQGTLLPQMWTQGIEFVEQMCDARTNLLKSRTLIFKKNSYASNLRTPKETNLIYENWR